MLLLLLLITGVHPEQIDVGKQRRWHKLAAQASSNIVQIYANSKSLFVVVEAVLSRTRSSLSEGGDRRMG